MRCLIILSYISLMGFLTSLSCPACAQKKYVFDEKEVCIPATNGNSYTINNQYLSGSLNKKLNEFYDLYTKSIDMGAPSHQLSTEIYKPDLFYSVKRLTEYFCKNLKKGKLSQKQVDLEFGSILEKSVQIFSSKTDQLEAELRKNNNPLKIIDVFDRIYIR